MSGSATPPPAKMPSQAACPFVIRLSADARRCSQFEQICLDVQRLGGQQIANGFDFPNATQRAAALDVLGDKYGARYFEPIGD